MGSFEVIIGVDRCLRSLWVLIILTRDVGVSMLNLIFSSGSPKLLENHNYINKHKDMYYINGNEVLVNICFVVKESHNGETEGD